METRLVVIVLLFIVALLFVFTCLICHAGKMSEEELLRKKEREWLEKGIDNEKK